MLCSYVAAGASAECTDDGTGAPSIAGELGSFTASSSLQCLSPAVEGVGPSVTAAAMMDGDSLPKKGCHVTAHLEEAASAGQPSSSSGAEDNRGTVASATSNCDPVHHFTAVKIDENNSLDDPRLQKRARVREKLAQAPLAEGVFSFADTMEVVVRGGAETTAAAHTLWAGSRACNCKSLVSVCRCVVALRLHHVESGRNQVWPDDEDAMYREPSVEVLSALRAAFHNNDDEVGDNDDYGGGDDGATDGDGGVDGGSHAEILRRAAEHVQLVPHGVAAIASIAGALLRGCLQAAEQAQPPLVYTPLANFQRGLFHLVRRFAAHAGVEFPTVRAARGRALPFAGFGASASVIATRDAAASGEAAELRADDVFACVRAALPDDDSNSLTSLADTTAAALAAAVQNQPPAAFSQAVVTAVNDGMNEGSVHGLGSKRQRSRARSVAAPVTLPAPPQTALRAVTPPSDQPPVRPFALNVTEHGRVARYMFNVRSIIIRDGSNRVLDVDFPDGVDGSKVVGALTCNTVTLMSLQRLQVPHWINDECVNFAVAELNASATAASAGAASRAAAAATRTLSAHGATATYATLFVFNSHFLPIVMSGANHYSYQRVQRWTGRANVDVGTVDIWLWPMHLGVHWVLAALDVRHCELHVFDSLAAGEGTPPGGDATLNVALRTLLLWYSDETAAKLGEYARVHTDSWTVRRHAATSGVPQQDNGSDCGMFMLNYARCIIAGTHWDFSQGDMADLRQRLALRIIDNPAPAVLLTSDASDNDKDDIVVADGVAADVGTSVLASQGRNSTTDKRPRGFNADSAAASSSAACPLPAKRQQHKGGSDASSSSTRPQDSESDFDDGSSTEQRQRQQAREKNLRATMLAFIQERRAANAAAALAGAASASASESAEESPVATRKRRRGLPKSKPKKEQHQCDSSDGDGGFRRKKQRRHR